MTDNLFARAKPKLNPPVSAWKADMPESREPQLVPPRLIWMNKINDVYLEIPRYDKGMTWWGMIPLGGGVLGIIFYILIDTISTQIQSDGRDFIPYFIALAGFVFFLSMFLSCIKIYFIMPREQPVRLNKMRQRIFVYKYKRIDPIPWMKWPVIITRYNWADVHGEIRYCSDRYRSGHQLWGSVCEPGTYNVIHRFQLADGEPAELQQVWSFLCLYMKGEPVPAEPKNKGRPDSWRPRKADKWPEEWERESTTAPDGSTPVIRFRETLPE
ncbi:DUF6708 domain-containing protein [Klebsiella michiganensis]|uniref:DUF6708 domain-containing protein n=3 Tax=Klebsiella michiganensis TaxID=1134687 RepID=UPI001CC91EC0|nr:DUF6708 domain-containing protein [Klebsiella michiganensis]MBZ6862028.1 hypothetical protein [Klebsiella michiganensis]